MRQTKKQWLIRGYDSTDMIYEKIVDVGQFTEDQIIAPLKALAAKAGLGFDEIVGAYAKRRTRIVNNLLEVRIEGPHTIFMCGSNPHFIASIVFEGSRKPIRAALD